MRSEPNDGLNSRCSGAVATALEPITEFNALDRRPGALAGDDFSFNSVRGGPGWSARPLIGDGPANPGSQMRPLPRPDAPVFQKLKNFAARKNRTREIDAGRAEDRGRNVDLFEIGARVPGRAGPQA